MRYDDDDDELNAQIRVTGWTLGLCCDEQPKYVNRLEDTEMNPRSREHKYAKVIDYFDEGCLESDNC